MIRRRAGLTAALILITGLLWVQTAAAETPVVTVNARESVVKVTTDDVATDLAVLWKADEFTISTSNDYVFKLDPESSGGCKLATASFSVTCNTADFTTLRAVLSSSSDSLKYTLETSDSPVLAYRVKANDGNDDIYTASGDDVVNAGDGNDFVSTGGGDDAIGIYETSNLLGSVKPTGSLPSREFEADEAACGSGTDTVYYDSADEELNHMADDCELKKKAAMELSLLDANFAPKVPSSDDISETAESYGDDPDDELYDFSFLDDGGSYSYDATAPIAAAVGSVKISLAASSKKKLRKGLALKVRCYVDDCRAKVFAKVRVKLKGETLITATTGRKSLRWSEAGSKKNVTLKLNKTQLRRLKRKIKKHDAVVISAKASANASSASQNASTQRSLNLGEIRY